MTRQQFKIAVAAAAALAISGMAQAAEVSVQAYPLPRGAYPHDVAPSPDGSVVWYSEQRDGALGRLDPVTGKVDVIPLGRGSAPHGVIVGPDGAPWLTDGGINALVRVDPKTLEIKRFPLPAERTYANLNTAVFARGLLWFTGQNGIYGRLDPASGAMAVFDAPKGRGPYGITATPAGQVYYASLAGNYVGKIDAATGVATVLQPPQANQGARRVWSDSKGMIWVSEWNAGNLSRYDPATNSWKSWHLPGARPQVYAVFVDDRDIPWVSDWGSNAIVRFDPRSETFQSFPSPRRGSDVRQMHGRPGEVWAAESGTGHLVVFRTRPQ